MANISSKPLPTAETKPGAVPTGSEAVDDYLKAIFKLSGREERQVSSTEIAVNLAITAASVTNMLQKLAAHDPPLVVYEKHHGVKLAKAGKKRALEIIRHHRLIETFLHEVLDYPWEEVHEEAERLEHFISERFEERIAAKLANPKFDPHGHCIPAMDGKTPKQTSIPLTDLHEQGTFIVDNISDQDAPLLKRLKTHGITPGARLQVANGSADDFVLRTSGVSKSLHLSRDLAAAVRVRSTREGR